MTSPKPTALSTPFESMTEKECFSIPLERRNVKFIALTTTLNFDAAERNLAGIDGNRRFTTPPSPVILNECLSEAFSYAGNDSRGCWIRFFLLTYFYEGQIWFQKADELTFAVQVKFALQTPTLHRTLNGFAAIGESKHSTCITNLKSLAPM
jgi:hypothetical protein